LTASTDIAGIHAAATEQRARLRWRCRRGMKELDVLLSGWLEREFERAGAAGRRQFEALLALPDPQLAGYLLGLERPEGVELASLVDSIRARRGIMSRPVAGGNLP